MNINKALAEIREQRLAMEKQAAETAPAPAAPAVETPVAAALKAATAPVEIKTASVDASPGATSSVEGIMKVASALSQADADANVKIAEAMGAAFADAATARFAAYEKEAAAQMAAIPSTKLASEDAKLAYEEGFRAGVRAEEAKFAAAYDETVLSMHKTASEEFLKAAAVTRQVLEAASKLQQEAK